MNVAGIDLSSHAIDVVKVPLEHDGQPQWHRFPLTGQDAFDRARSVRDSMPGRTSVFWGDVMAVGIEDPRGHSAGAIYRVQGAILSCLPPHLLVHPLIPSSWRRLVGLPGNASKQDVIDWVVRCVFDLALLTSGRPLEQDACDAYGIALATRTLITQHPQQEAA